MPPGPAYNWLCVANSVCSILSHAAQIRAAQLARAGQAVSQTELLSRKRKRDQSYPYRRTGAEREVPTAAKPLEDAASASAVNPDATSAAEASVESAQGRPAQSEQDYRAETIGKREQFCSVSFSVQSAGDNSTEEESTCLPFICCGIC
ncbi:hypothetical protein PYCCODRAFT_197409 [Trametes coccinea BRFM310]|uniref:Uncharacterized protein n=1 Tax=Trametes coccinea (strain BRFM310) TaxID=1353009 RepID=A0A1Y2IRS4_TRAC3|nr:hypothetical protein PYCCODRAFT_197409 [Trametes coccinea BRFM310]